LTTTIADVSEDTLAIESYLRSLKPGDTTTYAEIHKATRVRMDSAGKAKIRSAAKRANIIYTTIRGVGIQLADEVNGVPILADRLVRVDNATKRAEKIAATIYEQHGAKMTEENKATTIGVIAIFGTIRVLADQRRRELRRLEKARPKLAEQVVFSV
jgi:hypothetical protein